MKHTHDVGLDGLHWTVIVELAHEAALAHPTRVRPLTPHEMRINWEILRRALLAGRCGGPYEAL